MKYSPRLLILALGTLVLANCLPDYSNNNNGFLDKDYVPLKVGNRWVFDEVSVATSVRLGEVVKEVTGEEVFGETNTFVMTTTQTNSPIIKRSNWSAATGRIARMRQQRLSSTEILLSTRTYEPGFLRFDPRFAQAATQITEDHLRQEFDAYDNPVAGVTVRPVET